MIWEKDSLIYNICKKICKENVWRVVNLCYDIDDLMQECWVMYNKCKHMYPDVDDAQFVSILKNSIYNMLHRMSIESSHYNDFYENINGMEEVLVGESEKEIEFNLRMSTAPKLIKNVIAIFGSYKEDTLKKKNVSKNRMIKRHLGVHSEVNVIEFTKAYVRGEI